MFRRLWESVNVAAEAGGNRMVPQRNKNGSMFCWSKRDEQPHLGKEGSECIKNSRKRFVVPWS